jgi:pyrimidine-specific ribonucleoside hydrolase
MKRREFIGAGVSILAGGVSLGPLGTLLDDRFGAEETVPIVHITDLYHPPQDPDDHIDLLTLAALREYDLRGVILDATTKFLIPAPGGFDIRREPGLIPVAQLAHILGRKIPVAVGPREPLTHPGDTLTGRPGQELEGVNLLMDILDSSRESVVVSVVGSARPLAAAFNREPELLKKKVRRILLNAGSTGGSKQEWNVGLDPHAYERLWGSGLPISWYPCATESGAFNPDHARGTYWKTRHRDIFGSVKPKLRSWLAFAFSGSDRQDYLEVLEEGVDTATWDGILSGQRNMWATASLVMGAGCLLARLPEGWRFVKASEGTNFRVWPWRLDRIEASVDSTAVVKWREVKEGGTAMIFGRDRGDGYSAAMAEALQALLGTLG